MRAANLQTLQPVQTSVCSLTVAGFCGSAARFRRGSGRTPRPCGSTSVLAGLPDDVGVAVVQRLQKRCCEYSLRNGLEARCNAVGCAASRHAATRYDFAMRIPPCCMRTRHASIGAKR